MADADMEAKLMELLESGELSENSSEEEIMEALEDMKMVIADPLYRPICPEKTKFIPLPAESFSGRIYRNEIPNLIDRFE